MGYYDFTMNETTGGTLSKTQWLQTRMRPIMDVGTASLFCRTRVYQPSHTVGKKHIYFAGLDHFGYFAKSKRWVQHCLPSAIGTSAVVRCARLCCRTLCTCICSDAAFE